MTLNTIINERIGFGAFQVRVFLILCLIDMNDGVELVLSSFLNPIIKQVFPGVTSSFIAAMASIFYLGILCGSLTSGQLADKYGRRTLIRYGSIMQIAVALLFYMANSLAFLFLLRFIYGFSFGFTVAVTTSMFAEITPEKYRGKGVLLINFCISIGKLYGVCLGYAFIESDLTQSNWKVMMICGSLPNIIVLLGSYFVLTQSPRFLLTNQKYQEGIGVLNTMLKTNKVRLQISNYEQEVIREEFKPLEAQNQDHLSFKALVSNQNLSKTIAIATCWVIINFSFYGQLTIEAFHISGPKVPLRQGLSKYFFTVFGQLPSLFLTLYMIDHPQFGRKRSLIVYFLGATLFHFLFACTFWTTIGSIARFFMKDVFSILYPLTTESFETRIRTKGFGLCSGIGRVGSILMPFIAIPLDNWNPSSVYISFSVLSLVACTIAWKKIEETMHKSLDSEHEVKFNNQKSEPILLRDMRF